MFLLCWLGPTKARWKVTARRDAFWPLPYDDSLILLAKLLGRDSFAGSVNAFGVLVARGKIQAFTTQGYVAQPESYPRRLAVGDKRIKFSEHRLEIGWDALFQSVSNL